MDKYDKIKELSAKNMEFAMEQARIMQKLNEEKRAKSKKFSTPISNY